MRMKEDTYREKRERKKEISVRRRKGKGLGKTPKQIRVTLLTDCKFVEVRPRDFDLAVSRGTTRDCSRDWSIENIVS